MNVGQELGVQSFCFRHFPDNATVAGLVKQCGMDRIELCGIHVDFDRPETFDDVIAVYHDAGVQICSVGVTGLANKPDAERKHFDFCKAAGAKVISVDFNIMSIPDSFRTAEKLADEYDVRLGIHNHGGHHWLGPAQALEWVFQNTNPRIGLCLDTAWALDSGHDPVEMAEKFGDRLYGVHIKDFIFDSARKPEDVVVGTGNLDLPKFLETMSAVKFDGAVVLEYEGDVEDPAPAITRCVEAVRALCD